MLEFGSDFHLVEGFEKPTTGKRIDGLLLADGRHTIEILILANRWKRIWIPCYFCYDVVTSIEKLGIEIKFYDDFPGNNDEATISNLPLEDGDSLLRMNFFGLRGWRDNSKIGIPVIEDHSHAPLGTWVKSSNADWCIASLRKTLPIAEGGLLWSPRHLQLPPRPELTTENKALAETRWAAMRKKADYLLGKHSNKEDFRRKFLLTGMAFDNLALSLIDEKSQSMLHNFDYAGWFRRKQENWQILSSIKSKSVRVFESECNDNFSFTIICDTPSTRGKLRKSLIENNVYPAILWQLPQTASATSKDISERMLSIHCDARYSADDIIQLKAFIEKAADKCLK